MRRNHLSRTVQVTAVAFLLASLMLVASTPVMVQAAPLYTNIQASDQPGSGLPYPNTHQTVAVSSSGIIYIAFEDTANEVRVTRSTNRGASFSPSVLIATSAVSPNIAVDSSGVVYVTYLRMQLGNLYLSRSTDNGVTFSVPTLIAISIHAPAHIATDSPYVYVLPRDGQTLYVNNASGNGPFTPHATGLPGIAFSNVLVDPASGDIFVVGDDPSLHLVTSSDHGSTFGTVQHPIGDILYSEWTASFGAAGRFAIVSGGDEGLGATQAYRINLDTAVSTSLTFGNNSSLMQGRSLAADSCGNVVDSFTNADSVFYHVSQDLGTNFAAVVSSAGYSSIYQSIAINPSNLDIVIANVDAVTGTVNASVFSGELASCGAVPPAAAATPAPVTIPKTGFAPNRVSPLPVQTTEYSDMGDLWLEIPSLGVQTPIVGVPLQNGSWDVSWLGKDAGWLNGSAFPTLTGNSVLTAHVYDAFGKPGPFAGINRLWYGSQVIVHAGDGEYIYEVRSILQVAPDNITALMKHQDLPWLTLTTCRGYNESTDSYAYRILVRAVLVNVK